MPKWRLVFNGDNLYTEKDARIYKLKSSVSSKIDAIPWVIDSLDSTSSTDALSANMGKELQDQITELSWVWTFLSTWDATTWLPGSEPQEDPYTYRAGNYYIVSHIGATNYKPHWSTYTQWVPSTTVETDTISVNDWYLFDWATWVRQPAWSRQITIDSALSTTSTNAVENRVVTSALNWKQDAISDLATIRAWASAWATALQKLDNISELTNNIGYQTAWDVTSAINTAIQTLAPDWVWTWVLTLQKNSTTIDTFSANATQNKTIDISVPTTVAELSDASDYATKTYVDTEIWKSKSSWTVAPSNPTAWQLWYDTTNNILKVYDWTNWNPVDTNTTYSNWTYLTLNGTTFDVDTTSIATKSYVDEEVQNAISSWTTSPSNPVTWQLWYDTTNNVLKIYNGTSWDPVDTNTTYSAGTWLSLNGTTFSVDSSISWMVSDAAYSASWDGDTTHSPSKNAVYDVLWDINTLLANI